MPPETHYAKSGDINIAYQVVGDGPFDLVYVPGWVSNVELQWEKPKPARFLERLASFSRLILFDKRGTGMSDRVSNDRLPTLEQRMDDVRAVLDAVGSENAALLGHSEGGSMSVLFAATYPERSRALVLVGAFAKRPRTRSGSRRSRRSNATGAPASKSRTMRRTRIQPCSSGIRPICGGAQARAPRPHCCA